MLSEKNGQVNMYVFKILFKILALFTLHYVHREAKGGNQVRYMT